MALEVINNGESGLDVRTKINSMFSELYTEVASEPYPSVVAYANLPTATGSGDIYIVQTSTGIWPVRRPAGLWRDSGSWTWLGNFTWTAEEVVNVPAGAIVATNVQAALNELDTDLSGHIGLGGSAHPDATTSVSGFMSGADKTKLNGVATGATANSADATLLDRANHTGTQLASTVFDFNEAVDDRVSSLLQAGTDISLSYNDAANTLTINSTAAGGGGAAEPSYYIKQNSDYTLTSTTAVQKIFNASTNGRLTLTDTGIYEYKLVLYIQDMSATSGNAQLDLVGAGSAITDKVLEGYWGSDSSTPGTPANRNGGFMTTETSQTNMFSAGTGTGITVVVYGTMDVTTAGTIVPSIALTTAAAATVKIGTFFELRRLGDLGTQFSVGFD